MDITWHSLQFYQALGCLGQALQLSARGFLEHLGLALRNSRWMYAILQDAGMLGNCVPGSVANRWCELHNAAFERQGALDIFLQH